MVTHEYAVLRAALAKGVRLGMLRVNPCADIDLPRTRGEEMLFLTADEVRAVAEKIAWKVGDPARRRHLPRSVVGGSLRTNRAMGGSDGN